MNRSLLFICRKGILGTYHILLTAVKETVVAGYMKTFKGLSTLPVSWTFANCSTCSHKLTLTIMIASVKWTNACIRAKCLLSSINACLRTLLAFGYTCYNQSFTVSLKTQMSIFDYIHSSSRIFSLGQHWDHPLRWFVFCSTGANRTSSFLETLQALRSHQNKIMIQSSSTFISLHCVKILVLNRALTASNMSLHVSKFCSLCKYIR